jgi:peptidoglycan/LPS O-acetylase OafA/YrhL
MQSERSKPVNHLPSLDGLRAISISLVLIGHLDGTRNVGHLPVIYIFGNLAHFGVTVFFVISGFLITSLLIKEDEQTGTVSLKGFYLRRSLRIFPAAFVDIALVTLLTAASAISVSRTDLVCAATYTVNYLVHSSWYIGHLWSLSVEEQFYLYWAFAFATLSPRRAGWFAGRV